MILGQDDYQAIRPLEYFATDEKCSPFAVRLPISWVLSGPLPSSSSWSQRVLKPMSNSIMNWLVKSSLCMTWNHTARTSRLTNGPQPMLVRRKYLKEQLFIMARDTMLVSYGLKTTSSSRITTFRHWYSSSISKSGSREIQHWKKITLRLSVKTWKNVTQFQSPMLTWSNSGRLKSGTYHIIP